MHGGYKGFDKVIWTGEAEEDGDGATLKLRYTAADGEEGYPGRVDVLVTYRLDDENRFHMNWEAVTDKPTIIDMTSHVYLNLNGFRNENVMNEYLRVNASEYLEKDDTGTPTGTLFSVEGTPFDLRKAMPLDKLSNGGVYNPILKLDGEAGTLREVAEVSIPEKGRSYKLFTTGRALQVYNAYNVPQFFASNGLESPYGNAPGLCLEPQNYPNAVNIPSMPSPILRPGEVYSEKAVFRLLLVTRPSSRRFPPARKRRFPMGPLQGGHAERGSSPPLFVRQPASAAGKAPWTSSPAFFPDSSC